jgi:hypothetical protein
MTRIRVILFIVTIVIVGSLATLVSFYARGWRLNRQTGRFSPNGLLVVKSAPDGAQVFINGELKTATNANLALPPLTYDISIRKEGYIAWHKRLVIEKGIVTEVTAHLFKSTPSLSAVTFSGSLSPQPFRDVSKIAYVVPSRPNGPAGQEDLAGLWVMETVNLPIGFSRDPRRITDGVLTDATWVWSPDGREILLSTKTGVFLLNAGAFTPQGQRVNITVARRDEIFTEWEAKRKKRLQAKLKRLPDELSDILERRASSVIFSPDEDMIVYTASGSAEIPENLIKQLPGSSTQKQERNIKPSHTYVYDIKEDRNFLIDEGPNIQIIGHWSLVIGDSNRRLAWFPTSRNLVLAEDGKITIMDYDGTNRQVVYSGSYVAPHAFPTLSTDRLLILTNLGADSALPNLYSLSLK